MTEKEENNSYKILSPVRGVTRSIFGIVATATLLTASLVRGAIGAVAHAVTAIGGAIATIGLSALHGLNFIRYQATKVFNKLTKTSNKGNNKILASTKNILEKTAAFTSKQAGEAITNIPDVLAGKHDKKFGKNFDLITPKALVTTVQMAMAMSPEERKTANKKLEKSFHKH